MTTQELANTVALVTGGGANIGLGIANQLIAKGCPQIILAGRSQERLNTAKAQLTASTPAQVDTIRVDITDESSVHAMVTYITDRVPSLDIAVNNAGILGQPGLLDEMSADAFADVLNTNVYGTFLAMRGELSIMKPQGHGVIVNVASNIGFHGRRPQLAAYAASKAAISVLTRNAALENIGHGIRINAVSPGATDTPMSLRPGETEDDRAQRIAGSVPIGRIASVSEIANAVAWLCSPESSYVVGHDLVIDGGVTA